MSLYRRRDAQNTLGSWWVDIRWRGLPRIQQSTGTTNKTQARAIHRTLTALREAGRLDVLGLVAAHKLTLNDVHTAWPTDRSRLTHEVARSEAPTLGTLADEWLA